MTLFYRIASTADGGVARDYPHTFDGVAITGQLLALHPDWVADFVKSMRKPFFIDPSCYVFSLDLGNLYREGDLRQSYEALAKHLALRPVFEEAREIQQRDILRASGDLTEMGRELVHHVVEANQFRWGQGSLQLALDDYATMLEEGQLPSVEPVFILPPYFHNWPDVNLALARETKAQSGEAPVYMVFSMAKELLGDGPTVAQMLEMLDNLDGCIIWVSDFQERSESLEKLVRFADMVETLANTGKPVYNLYGGGFSSLLGPLGLAGYSRGIGTSESRDVDMETGQGAPPTRYYISEALTQVVMLRAQRLYALSGLPICHCPICQVTVGEVRPGEPQPSLVAQLFGNLSPKDCRAHFMERHWEELNSLRGLDVERVKEWLLRRQGLLIESHTGGLVPTGHLPRWSQALDLASS